MEGGFLLYTIVCAGPSVFQPFPRKYEALLVQRDGGLGSNLDLHQFDSQPGIIPTFLLMTSMVSAADATTVIVSPVRVLMKT